MTQDFVIVLDIGSTKAACVAASLEGDDMKVLAHAVEPCDVLKKGNIFDMEGARDVARSVVRRVQKEAGQETDSLVVTITGQHIEGRSAQGLRMIVPRGRAITHQDVLEVIKHSRAHVLPPDREQIQAIPREFRVDGDRDVRKPVGRSASRLEVVTYLVTGLSTIVQHMEKAVTSAGWKVEQMVLTPLAAGVGVLTADEMEAGVAVVDIGGATTDVAVFAHGSLAYSVCFPVGSWHVTNDLCKLLKVVPDEAERLKAEHGYALADAVDEDATVEVLQFGDEHTRPMRQKVLAEIVESRMREIAQIVFTDLKDAGYETTLAAGVVVTGGGSKLRATEHLYGQVFRGMPARCGIPKADNLPQDPALAAVAGLARFSLQCRNDMVMADGVPVWRQRVRSLFKGR
jgi:cell division protein FtsA